MSDLELRIPPVAVGLIAAGMMWCTAAAAPELDFPLPGKLLIVVGLGLIGAVICLAGVVSFGRARTTVNPMNPEFTSSLVVSGIYRFTRNPMYLGFLVVLAAWASALSNLLAPVFLPAFVFYINRFQISPEERVLAALFSPEYVEYCARVRRWL